MVSFRSPETLQKEFDLQAVETVKMNLKIQQELDFPESTYRGQLEDAAVFANNLRKSAPKGSLVVLQNRPVVSFKIETEEYNVELAMTGNCWWYKVNETVDETTGDKFGPARALKSLWDVAIAALPEEFIIRGVISSTTPDEVYESRDSIRQGLGLSKVQSNGEVYGIVRNHVVTPLGLDEFLSLTGKVPAVLSQKFSVRTINWQGN